MRATSGFTVCTVDAELDVGQESVPIVESRADEVPERLLNHAVEALVLPIGSWVV